MIRSYQRPAVAEDMKAMKEGKGSFARNLLTITLPIGALLFVGMYWLFNSSLLALALAGLFVAGSTWSNTRFFRTVGARETSGTGRPKVEVIEVDAVRVLDIEHLGSHGPAYCFFTDDNRALLLIGQWLMRVPKFPSLSFRLFLWIDDGTPIRIESTGRTAKPEHSTISLKSHYSNSDIEVFPAQPETLQQDLEKAFGKGAS
jgi:hypothetical protein